MRHERLYLLFRKELTFFVPTADITVGKRVSRYQPILVRMGHDRPQWGTIKSDCGLLHTHLIAEIDAELVEEVPGKFIHADVVPLVVILDEVSHMGTGYGMLV